LLNLTTLVNAIFPYKYCLASCVLLRPVHYHSRGEAIGLDVRPV
jgi:hypothetical protein